MIPKFRAKVNLSWFVSKLDNELITRIPLPDWLEKLMDKEGYVTGYYVKGPNGAYLVGELVEVYPDYTVLEYWIPVDEFTLEVAE